jgi:hypothetical protein
MSNEVEVKSGIGLGMKIAFGFMLAFCLLCTMCGGLASLPSAVSNFKTFQERSKHRDAGPADTKR